MNVIYHLNFKRTYGDKWYNKQGFELERDFPDIYKHIVEYKYLSYQYKTEKRIITAWSANNRRLILIRVKER